MQIYFPPAGFSSEIKMCPGEGDLFKDTVSQTPNCPRCRGKGEGSRSHVCILEDVCSVLSLGRQPVSSPYFLPKAAERGFLQQPAASVQEKPGRETQVQQVTGASSPLAIRQYRTNGAYASPWSMAPTLRLSDPSPNKTHLPEKSPLELPVRYLH